VSTRLLASRAEHVLLLTLESPDAYPKLTTAVLGDFERAFRDAASDSEIRGLVVTGSEHAFAVGADIAEIAQLTAVEAREFSRRGQAVFGTIERFAKPVVAAILGYCMGGGLDLALACRERIASPGAIFAHRGAWLGLLTGWGGTQRLPRLLGRARALEIFVTGMPVTAAQALDAGLVSRVVPPGQLIAAAVGRAAELAAARAANTL
jgi:enoyl-CoA hydratase